MAAAGVSSASASSSPLVVSCLWLHPMLMLQLYHFPARSVLSNRIKLSSPLCQPHAQKADSCRAI